jgi:TM2 domain-containing membrane protein YozV
METQLYVRIRGRVLGPFDKEKLKLFARQGQLGRMHELSQDATNWVQASTYPELFVSGEHPVKVDAVQTPKESQNVAQGTPPEHLETSRTWWYRKNNSEAGPVDKATIQQLLGTGNITPDDSVWTEGMRQWVPARQVPDLVPVMISRPPSFSGDTKFCHHCGNRITSLAEICPKCGVRQAQTPTMGGQPATGPNKVVACLLALFLGGLGIHKFYLGQTAAGVIYLLAFIFLFWTMYVPIILYVVCLVEGIGYLTYSDTDFARKYGGSCRTTSQSAGKDLW